MADLDNQASYGGALSKFTEQPDGNPVTMMSVDLGGTGQVFSAYVQVMTREESGSGAVTAAEYNALLHVSAWYNSTGASWQTNLDTVHSYGTQTVTWALAMNGNAVEITADSAAGDLHGLSVASGLSTEFAMAFSVS